MYFYKKVEIDIFFKYSDFGQGESTLNVHVGGESHCADFLKKFHKGSKIKAEVRHYVPQNILQNTYFATFASY